MVAADVLRTSKPTVTALSSRLSCVCMGLWSTRLAGFLFYRALQTGHDARLDGTLSTAAGATGFWSISFLWGVVCSLPHTLALGMKPAAPKRLGAIGACGVALFAYGLGWEVIADYQKYSFKNDAANQGKFCNQGLWAFSQQPNYFGNLMLWGGIFLLNAPTLAQRPVRLGLAALGPLFMTALFYAQASGAMANTRELALIKYGHDPGYRRYIETVPLIVTWPGAAR